MDSDSVMMEHIQQRRDVLNKELNSLTSPHSWPLRADCKGRLDELSMALECLRAANRLAKLAVTTKEGE